MTTNPYVIGVGNYYEGKNTQEMLDDVRRWLGVASTDTTRYSDADIVKALNMGQERFAYLTACLLMPVIIVVKADRQNYRVPFNALRVLAGVYYKGTNRYDYEELTLLKGRNHMKSVNPYYRGETGDPQFLFPSYRSGNILLVGISPIPTTDGESWVGTDYGILQSATGFTNVGNVLGTHKTGFSSSAFLVDSAGRDLTLLGAMVGYPIYNVTDGSAGIITAIGNQAATNDKVSATLAGGTHNAWNTGDSFQIPMAEYGVVMDVAGNDEQEYIMNSYFGTIADIYGKTGNLMLDVARAPLPLSETLLDSISEIPAVHQDAVIGYAVYELGRASFKGIVQLDKSQEGMTEFNRHVAEYNTLFEVVPTNPPSRPPQEA